MNNKTTSPKKIESNRRNARRSTGPRTAAGKAASCRNAIKHGILSRDVVLCGYEIRESSDEFDTLQKQFWEEYDPVGPVEKMLVERIVTTYWRLQRAITAESGEIELSVDGGHWQRHKPDPDRIHWQHLAESCSIDAALKMQISSLGVYSLRDLLKDIRAMVEKDGELTEAALQKTHIAGKPNYLTCELAECRDSIVENADNLDADARKAKKRDQILARIDVMRDHFWWDHLEKREREEAEEDSRQAAATLPAADKLDKILRYETTMERQLYRAMGQLERLQRMRKGEDVPPPVSVEVTR